jgi:hypothetical protein
LVLFAASVLATQFHSCGFGEHLRLSCRDHDLSPLNNSEHFAKEEEQFPA